MVPPSCPTLQDLMEGSLPGSSVRDVLQARMLEWVAMHFSRGPSPPKDGTHTLRSPAWAGEFVTTSTTGEALLVLKTNLTIILNQLPTN